MQVNYESVTQYSIDSVCSKGRAPLFFSHISPGFLMHRIFWVNGTAGEVRGRHAHHKCRQLLICPVGSVHVKLVTKSGQTDLVSLSCDDNVLLVEPLTWLEIKFQVAGTLMVVCDREYESTDYIYDLEEISR